MQVMGPTRFLEYYIKCTYRTLKTNVLAPQRISMQQFALSLLSYDNIW